MSDVLRRKLSAPRARPAASTGVSVAAVLRKVMPRDADSVLSLDLAVTEVETGLRDRDDLLADFSEHHLSFLLEAEDGARGLIQLAPELLSGIVEVQVAGRVSDRPAPERAPTRTDATVSGEILDAWLATAESEMAEAGLDSTWPALGFERSPGHLTQREMALLLEPVEFRHVDIALSFGGGAKSGILRLATPRRDHVAEGHAHGSAARVRSHLPDLPVALHAILARFPLDMTKAEGLLPDELLPLPEGCLQAVRLEAPVGRLIRRGQLGQLDGKRAVRLGVSGPKPSLGMLSGPPAAALAALPDGVGAADAPPELPDLPDLPDLPEQPGAEPLPDLPEPGELPDLPDLPNLPDAEPGADAPEPGLGVDLPPLPDLPDLPDLPELPDLP